MELIASETGSFNEYDVVVNEKNYRIRDFDRVWPPTAFGLLLATFIDKEFVGGKTVLDMGCGSGLLTIVAQDMEAEKVTCLDINPDAREATIFNVRLNGQFKVPDVRDSDKFSAIRQDEKFDVLLANPPTFPKQPNEPRISRVDFEASGQDGRYILDSVLTEGFETLEQGGQLLLVTTSKEGFQKTSDILNEKWKEWELIAEQLIPLADYYYAYIDVWLEETEDNSSFPRLYEKDGTYYQKLYVIKATK